MSEWIDIRNKLPDARIVWVLRMGRCESDGERDTVIQKMITNKSQINKSLEFRSLDYAEAIYHNCELDVDTNADFDTILAWKYLGDEEFPNWLVELLK